MTTASEAREALLNPTYSSETEAAILSAVEYAIEAEYGADNRREALTARTLARSAVEMDVVRLFVAANGNVHGISSFAQTLVRIAVAERLAERLCQCSDIGSGKAHYGPCGMHTEKDVPDVNGAKLCGPCYALGHTNQGGRR